MERRWLAMLLAGASTLLYKPLIIAANNKQPVKKKIELAKKLKESKHKLKPKSEKRKKDIERDIYQWFQTYSEVVNLVERKSFRTVDFSEFIQDSLKLAVSQIDAHSSFFTRKSYKAAMESTSGEFSGIGVSVITKAVDDDALVVVDVIQGGPSEKAGLQAGDKIVEIAGEKLKGLAADEVISKLKGKVGTSVLLRIIRKKKPMQFTVKRDIIKDQTSQSYRFKDQDVNYLSLKIFNEVAAQQIEELLNVANEGKCKGLVLDLRRNPGGTLDSAIEIAGLFLKKGSLVTLTKNNDGKVVRQYKTKRDPVLKREVPIFIMVDNFTASASEILAGALQYHSQDSADHKHLMVFIVGTPSFGKGSVQELIPVKNGCALKLTTLLYYLPDDSSIQAVGIQPDFLMKPKIVPEEEIKWVRELYGKETSLKHHITEKEVKSLRAKEEAQDKEGEKKGFWQRLFTGENEEAKTEVAQKKDEKETAKEKEKSWEEKQQDALMKDVQVQASVNLINLFDIAKKANKELATNRPKALSFLKANYITDSKVSIEKVK